MKTYNIAALAATDRQRTPWPSIKVSAHLRKNSASPQHHAAPVGWAGIDAAARLPDATHAVARGTHHADSHLILGLFRLDPTIHEEPAASATAQAKISSVAPLAFLASGRRLQSPGMTAQCDRRL